MVENKITTSLRKIEDEFSKEILDEIERWLAKTTPSASFKANLTIIKGKIDLLIADDLFDLKLDLRQRNTLAIIVNNHIDVLTCLKEALETLVDQNQFIQKLKEKLIDKHEEK